MLYCKLMAGINIIAEALPVLLSPRTADVPDIRKPRMALPTRRIACLPDLVNVDPIQPCLFMTTPFSSHLGRKALFQDGPSVLWNIACRSLTTSNILRPPMILLEVVLTKGCNTVVESTRTSCRSTSEGVFIKGAICWRDSGPSVGPITSWKSSMF